MISRSIQTSQTQVQFGGISTRAKVLLASLGFFGVGLGMSHLGNSRLEQKMDRYEQVACSQELKNPEACKQAKADSKGAGTNFINPGMFKDTNYLHAAGIAIGGGIALSSLALGEKRKKDKS